jgi:hypothetical protein
MAEDKIPKLSTSDLNTLQHLSDLLHLFHHRNKNQHRRSIWWRHFSAFRRQLNALVSEVQSLHEVPTTHLQRSRKTAQDRETAQVILKRIEFWRDVLVPKWHTSFSQIVTDGRFAVLGLVLIAVLAQSCQIAGINSGIDEAEGVEAEHALKDLEGARDEPVAKRVGTTTHDGEDLGEVIDRDEMTREAKDEASQQIVTAKPGAGSERSKGSTTSSTPARKRRKKGNAIDDLFSGLG